MVWPEENMFAVTHLVWDKAEADLQWTQQQLWDRKGAVISPIQHSFNSKLCSLCSIELPLGSGAGVRKEQGQEMEQKQGQEQK